MQIRTEALEIKMLFCCLNQAQTTENALKCSGGELRFVDQLLPHQVPEG